MLSAQGDLSIFFSKKLVGFMTTLALLLLFWPLISAIWSKMRRGI
jgi:putative tricarboxylic transport membrane protein